MPETAYGRSQRRIKAEKKKKASAKRAKAGRESRFKEVALQNGRCGVMKKNGTHCRMWAGQGTTHQGSGPCKYHGGNLPNVIKADVKKHAVLMGAPKEINPLDGLIWCIKLVPVRSSSATTSFDALEKEDQWMESTIAGQADPRLGEGAAEGSRPPRQDVQGRVVARHR
jgi:hypothetical protein